MCLPYESPFSVHVILSTLAAIGKVFSLVDRFDSTEGSMLCLEKIHKPSERVFGTCRTMKRPRQHRKRQSSDRIGEQIGLVIYGADAAGAAKAIVAAEAADVRQVWMTQFTSAPDTMAIVPTYPRHPLSLTLGDLAPNRLRLGIGPSHRPTIEGFYGIPMTTPLDHLHEYVDILRAILWQGEVDYQGHFFTVKTTFPRTPRTPILISALRTGA